MAACGGQRRRWRTSVIRSSFSPCSPASMSSTQRIGSKWVELQGLQGARDWDGLLRPLDGALRGQLVRYGEFVRALYGSCRFPSRSLLRRTGMPATGYPTTTTMAVKATVSPVSSVRQRYFCRSAPSTGAGFSQTKCFCSFT